MKFRFPLTLAVVLSLFVLTVFADDEIVWRPVTPEELQMKAPKVEADADAEAIFWEIRLDDKKQGKMSYSHYVRVKIFTERGRERFAKMDIPFAKGKKVEAVAARVIKPDGSIIMLKPEDIFEREIAKAGKAKVLAKSFAVPGIEPGVIVEYQYKEVLKNDSAGGERLWFQRDIPMQNVTYYVRPYESWNLSFNPYNMPDGTFKKDTKGYQVGTLTNVPAFKEEPYMPPEDEVRKWVYLQYTGLGTFFQWGNLSMVWTEVLKRLSKPNKEVKAKAAELTAGAATEEEKLRRIYDFVQKNIKNISFDPTLTEEQVEKMDIKDADDALRKGMGTSVHIELLFASLAKAAGFEVSMVLSGDRSENFFHPDKYPYQNFVHPACIAVNVGQQWQYFNPGTPYLPYGRLVWYEEDTRAMLINDNNWVWKQTPMAPHEKSPAIRTGKFTLLADGTLEGNAKIEFDGQQAIVRRRNEYRDSAAKREENMTEELKERLSTAEITNMRVENFDDNSKPLTYLFDVKIPNYAQKAGKRLILQPGFFETGSKPVFSSDTRTYDIFFPYPWSEQDKIEIQLPKDFTLEADSPVPLADPKNIASIRITMAINKNTNTLTYNRKFHFGGGGYTLFPPTAYPVLKNLFDRIHRSDTHQISIKQAAAQ